MKNLRTKLKALAPTRRKIIQLYFALLFNANLKGFVSGTIYKGNSKNICVPGINCYSCPGAVGACPIGSLQGSFSAGKSTIYYVCGILLLYSILFGRLICGWLCPFGLIQELLYKIKTPKLKKSPVTRILSYFKYVVLVFFVFIVPIAYAFRDTPLPAFCKYICPAGTIEGGLGLLSNKLNASYFSMLGPLFTWKFCLMISIVVGSVFIFRLFCRFICPLGALYGLFNRISLFGAKVNQPQCTNCNLCVSHCKLDVKHVGDQECISCGECMNVCPTKAIQWKGSEFFLRKGCPSATETNISEKGKKLRRSLRVVSWILAIGILIGAVVYYWNDTPTVNAVEGNEIGDLCPGYDLEILDKTGLQTETIDPTETGTITIINFWGTWCGPCVKELPYFDQIATDYKDQVKVIAIHTHSVYDTAPGYIAENYPDSKIIFAKDYPTDAVGFYGGYYTSLGGRDTYPYIVVLDENGIIVDKIVSALEYEDLKEIVDELINE